MNSMTPSLSRIALGTAQWGSHYGIANQTGKPSLHQIQDLLEIARGCGISTLDTARAYGESEDAIGRLTEGQPHWSIVTKLAPDVGASRGAASIVAAAEQSLLESRQSLRRVKLDTVMLHRAEHRQIDNGRVWDLLRRERDRGLIGRLGVSVGCPQEAWEALQDSDIEVLQVACNLLDQRLQRTGFFTAASAAGREVYLRSVFLQGLAYRDLDDLGDFFRPLAKPLADIRQWEHKSGVERGFAFLAYAATLPVEHVILGCELASQLSDNVAAWAKTDLFLKEIMLLAADIADLPVELVTPSMWPKILPANGASQTTRAA